jgi:hypothetical protein
MAYVDLNPIRAGIAKTAEESEFTSISDRIKQVRALAEGQSSSRLRLSLRPISDKTKCKHSIPFSLHDYLLLVDWSGRAIQAGTENCSCVSSVPAVHGGRKRGFIDAGQPPILKRLNIDSDSWEILMSRRSTVFGRAMGRLDTMRLHAATLGQSWARGMRKAERIFAA